MNTVDHCPTCLGVRFRDSSPGGHCPRCLLGLGLGLPGAAEGRRGGPKISRSERRLGRFTIVGVAGRGPRGVVYEAYDDEGTRLALKVMRHAASVSGDRDADSVTAAWVGGSLRHPHLVDVIEQGVADGKRYLALAWQDGGSLGALIARRRGAPGATQPGAGASEEAARAGRWMTSAARGLSHLHHRGLAHGNVKPGNVLLDASGSVRLSDPGGPGAEDALPAAPADRPLAAVGYRAPELWALGGGSSRGDVYALGATIYEALAGCLPFDGVDEESYVDAACSGRAVPIRSRRRDVPRPLETVVMRCLETDPARRFADAGALESELAAWTADGGSATDRGILGRAASFLKRRRGGPDRGESD